MTAHWDRLGGDYEEEWRGPARQLLSTAELRFVTDHLDGSPAGRVLDVGVGSGRVLAALLGSPRVDAAIGMDASEAMVTHCRLRFADEPRLETVLVRNAVDGPPPEDRFGFVSAIRVLKYEASWPHIVASLAASVEPGGVLVLTMPNRRSLNILSRPYAVPWCATTVAELRELARSLGLEVVALTAFTKLPHGAYQWPRGRRLARLPVVADRMLARALGDRRFGRELFVALRVPS